MLADGGRRVLKDEADSKSEAELFDQQLRYTNELMKRTVASLLDGPDETRPHHRAERGRGALSLR